jgi:hypothetical protein
MEVIMQRHRRTLTTKSDWLLGAWGLAILIIALLVIVFGAMEVGHNISVTPTSVFKQSCLDEGGDPVYTSDGEQLVCIMNGKIVSYF